MTEKKGYYHLCTDGLKDGRLFHNNGQYSFGMSVVGLLTIKYDIRIYAFVLMPNHIHIIMSGTEGDARKAFSYIRRKISARLARDGFEALPDNYSYKLIPIEGLGQMRANYLYVLRNPYEKNECIPCGYPWGSGWLCFSNMTGIIPSKSVKELSIRALRQLTGSHRQIPESWRFNERIGLLPSSFIDDSIFRKLFRTPKQFVTLMIKDYEAYVIVAESLDEKIEYTPEEIDDMVRQILQEDFPGRRLPGLSREEKGQMAVKLVRRYGVEPADLKGVMDMSEALINQFVNAKEFRKFQRPTAGL